MTPSSSNAWGLAGLCALPSAGHAEHPIIFFHKDLKIPILQLEESFLTVTGDLLVSGTSRDGASSLGFSPPAGSAPPGRSEPASFPAPETSGHVRAEDCRCRGAALGLGLGGSFADSPRESGGGGGGISQGADRTKTEEKKNTKTGKKTQTNPKL